MDLKFWRGSFGLKFWVYLAVLGMMLLQIRWRVYGATFVSWKMTFKPFMVKMVCIKTLKSSLIHDKISVFILGISNKLVVKEISNWEPDIVFNEETLDRELPNLLGDSDNDENGYEDNEGEDTGECNTCGINQTNE